MTVGDGGSWQPPTGGPVPPRGMPGVDSGAAQGYPANPQVETEATGRAFPLRWILAGVATLAVAALIIGILALSSPQAAGGLTRIAAAGSSLYFELRMDLPGDQRDRFAAFLQHFPGFADTSTFETKILDTFDQLVLNVTGGQYDWRSSVDPWFGGQVAGYVIQDGDMRDGPAVVLALSVKDRTAAEAFVEQLVGMSEMTLTYYRDVPIYDQGFGSGAIAVSANAVLVGINAEAIRQSIDIAAGDGPNLEEDERFRSATAETSADRLALLYIDGTATRELIEPYLDSAGMFGPGPAAEQLVADLHGTMVFELRAETDQLRLTSRSRPEPGSSPAIPPVSRSTDLAELAPANSIFYSEGRDYGRQVKEQVNRLVATAGGRDEIGLEEIEQFLGMPLEEYVDFLGDASFSISAEGDRYSGGLIALVNNEADARQRLERLSGAIRAAAAVGALPITVEEQAIGETWVTVFRLTEEAGQQIPDLEQLPISSISFTITRGMLLLGVDGFVAEALNRTPDSSLASAAGYRAALEAAGGADNAGLFYLDVTGAREQLEMLLPDWQQAQYANEIRPYLEPFKRLVGVSTLDGDVTVTRVILFVE